MKIHNQKGFTIVELMISLLLGLIILTAVVQVYIMSTRTAVVQQSGSQILDANVFGLQRIETNLRLAGLDMANKSTVSEPFSGIIAGVSNVPVAGLSPNFITRTGNLPTNTSRASSDQLTIQYRAPTDMRDCEGKLALGEKDGIMKDEEGELLDKTVPIKGQPIIERYFLKDDNGILNLYCDAGRYETLDIESLGNLDPEQSGELAERKKLFGVKSVQGMGKEEALIASNIDDFKVLFAVADGNNILYVNPTEYARSHSTKAIVAVKLAILAKGNVPTMESDISVTSFDLLGESVTLKSGVSQNYIRRVYESNSMLRNSRERK